MPAEVRLSVAVVNGELGRRSRRHFRVPADCERCTLTVDAPSLDREVSNDLRKPQYPTAGILALQGGEDVKDRLADMKTRLRDWEDEFGVESPNQLRGTLADESVDADEEDRRREITREWEHIQRRIQIVGFAIREWDFLAPTTEPAEASS